ncbi:hypothetical protein DP939_04325 [Spongiactinospora rosea]|uniref:Uncharacterized protein n=1 Tax=Spongiactinospora rosea TaxID=2248750 RepID=A0A366M8H7_9ACTN|nr:hypothetical protein [Spongiactinospora rosea]RBQ21904.1 hypothetical protein DP939_04325 [Spongiactinospora rosea]
MSRAIGDMLIAPEATRGETVTAYATAAAGAVLAGLISAHAGHGRPVVALLALAGFDLFGGTVVNATASAKRRFHRPGRTARHHFLFVAGHVHPFLMALLVPGFGWGAAGAVYGLAVTGALGVLATPAELRRPVAFAVAALASTVSVTLLAIPVEVAWFAPVLFGKLLLGHILPE